MDSDTPASEARNARFCKISSRPGDISTGSILPGKLEPNAIMPAPRAV